MGVSIAYPPDMATPGYVAENETKPAVLRAVDAALGAELFSAAQVAAAMLKGMEQRRYHLPAPDLGVNVLISNMTGLTPGGMPLLLRVLLAPVLVLVSWWLTRSMDKAAARLVAENMAPATQGAETAGAAAASAGAANGTGAAAKSKDK